MRLRLLIDVEADDSEIEVLQRVLVDQPVVLVEGLLPSPWGGRFMGASPVMATDEKN